MIYAIVVVLALILDQAVKYWVTVSIPLNTGAVTAIPGVLSFVNIHNSGAAFGILQNMRWLFVLLAIAFVALVTFALAKKLIRQPLGCWSAVLVTAGALGNCIDRVMNGYVVDMFRLDFVNFAVFNVADIYITVCGLLFCVYIIFGEDFREKATEGGAPRGKKPARKARPEAAPAEPLPAEEPMEVAAEKQPPLVDEEFWAAPAAPSVQPPKAAAAGSPAPAPAPEKSAPAPEKPAAQPQAEVGPEDFSLEDILAEFSSK